MSNSRMTRSGREEESGCASKTTSRIISGCHALVSGLVFIVLAGLLVAPVAHRVLHRFHYEAEDEKNR
jgi:hypothetical protein